MKPCAVLYQISRSGIKQWKKPTSLSLSKSFGKDSPRTTVRGKRLRTQSEGREERSPAGKEGFEHRNERVKEWKRPSLQSLSKSFRGDTGHMIVRGKRPRKQTDWKDEHLVARKEAFGHRNGKVEGNGNVSVGYRDTMVKDKKRPTAGYRTEMRRMSSEFAAMRREELQKFPDEISKPVKHVSKPANPPKSNSSPPSTSPSTAKQLKANSPKSQLLHIPILLESPEIVCINKPPSLLSQPGLPGEGTILDLLNFQRPDLSLQTVNRLDKNTSGAMVLGRTETAIRELNLFFKQGKIDKNYLAFLKPKPGTPLYTPEITSCRVLTHLTNPKTSTTKSTLTKKTHIETGKLTILQTPKDTSGYIQTYNPETKTGSLSHFQILLRLENEEKIFVQFTPLTGKKHQLRLHAAFLLGAPVVGDHRYGYPQDDGAVGSMRVLDGVYKDGYALHCYRVATRRGEIEFDVCASLPSGRWANVWDCVKMMVEGDEFEGMVRGISEGAKEVFLMEEVVRFLDDPTSWAKGIRGPLVKQEML